MNSISLVLTCISVTGFCDLVYYKNRCCSVYASCHDFCQSHGTVIPSTIISIALMSMKLQGLYVHKTTKLAIQKAARRKLGIWYFLCEAPVPVPLSLPGLPQVPSSGSAQLVKLAPPENRDSMLFCEQTCY